MSTDFLLRGGWFALEHAGQLVNDASILLEAGSHATAAGLALLSREELAKSRKLFALWMRAARGQEITRKQVEDEIDLSHMEKQQHGASMFSMSVDDETMEILKGERNVTPEEFEAIRRQLNARVERLIESAPADRHRQRLRAFYVDPAKDGALWLRPSDLSKVEAEEIVRDANNDYWQHRSPGLPARTSDLDALRGALAAWDDKPELPPATVT